MNATQPPQTRTPRLALAAALVLAAAAPAARAAVVPVGPVAAGVAAQGSFGSIKGRLVWGGAEAPPVKELVAKGAAQKDPNVCAVNGALLDRKLVVDPKTKGIQYGFAYLVRPTGSNPEAVKELVKKHPEVEIDQKHCEFIPYATALHQDQTVEFKSSDAVGHNIHLSPFTNAPLNQMLAPNASLEKKLTAERRVIPLTCDIHPWMKGWIMVFDHPFFAVTGQDGTFEIKGVPAGKQTLVVWQESGGYVTPNAARGMEVEVTAGKATDIGDVKLDPSKAK